jgi:hypothetical protein
MRSTALVLILAAALAPRAVAATDVAITCTITDEDTVITDPVSAPQGTLFQEKVFKTENFTITDSALVTTLAPPCDKMTGEISSAHVKVSCVVNPSLVANGSDKIEIDRQMGTLKEAFASETSPGSNGVTYSNGTCVKRQAF